ncbi:hypothetical protein HAZT_HAZT003042 [Hyalella azteca]|uniref:Uncharacterized protein n=1 Tax=Hyalella azteca TaxID=294128 RepID=A0A6A0HDA5_HYAAZ|nr:hypothetical protein HAZT_HAZT003042 [Hyalella azteca]
MGVPAVNSVDSSFPGNLLPSNFFEDVKKEEFDIEDLESFEDAFRDIDFDLIQSEDLDMSDVRPENSNASGFSLGNDCDPFSLVLENGEATSYKRLRALLVLFKILRRRCLKSMLEEYLLSCRACLLKLVTALLQPL